MNDKIRGRVWVFGDDINTDLILPNTVLYKSVEEQATQIFAANRPGWINSICRGDIIVAGKNFGTGSSRPASRSLLNAGIGCLLAESLNSLFFRNCVNFGFLAFECPGIQAEVKEEGYVEVDLATLNATVVQTRKVFACRRVPQHLVKIMREGGTYAFLEEQGLIEPESTSFRVT